MADERGAFADAARAREQQLAARLASSIKLDQSFEELVRGAHQHNLAARNRLDVIEAEIRQRAATWPGLDTPAGARQFQTYLAGKTREIHRVVSEAAADSRQRAAKVNALSSRYSLGGEVPQAPLNIDGDKPDPQIDDAAGKVDGTPEQKHDDLGATIPGTGIRLGGDGDNRDGRTGYPQIHIPGVYDGDNPLPVRRDANGAPLERPLPTGTALGPNGEHYGLYAMVPYDSKGYTAPDTVIVDLANPSKVVGTLSGVSQASGAFDKATGQMIVVGNTPTGQRAMWTSEPVAQNPNWISSANAAQPRVFTGAMDGNRESQIVAMPQGGMMLVGATGGGPVQAAVAATPDGLLGAQPHVVSGLIPDEIGPGWTYGPTVTDFNYNPDTGRWDAHLRVSTWTGGLENYNPKTYGVTVGGTN
ncbi:DUF4226 domain-containing protein [Mycolicibacter sp. MYC123]|uniref:DUF4226 domain-containing protein n=1 Tax=[Mycobacterium] zoologicum TaxID=2872311 RepID=A0ABU5YJ21_9MYCO|nr:DUF4226 domain-containing protein [Mycolicibacter sp. MYC123]MEB3050045.1 DUF4226 domain-containing protein [Mycolicibacter sp. MYC123]